MAYTTIDNLRFPKPGDPIRAADIAALMQYAKASRQVPKGFTANDAHVFATRAKRVERWVRCVSDDACDPYGIMEAYGGTITRDGLELLIRTPTNNDSVLVANEGYELFANTPGWVRLLNFESPCMVRLNSESALAEFNDVLGISSANSQELMVDESGGAQCLNDAIELPGLGYMVNVTKRNSALGIQRIDFDIVGSSDNVSASVSGVQAFTVYVTAASIDGQVHGEDPDHHVTVWDTKGLVSDEDPLDLVGRGGWATLMYERINVPAHFNPRFILDGILCP